MVFEKIGRLMDKSLEKTAKVIKNTSKPMLTKTLKLVDKAIDAALAKLEEKNRKESEK